MEIPAVKATMVETTTVKRDHDGALVSTPVVLTVVVSTMVTMVMVQWSPPRWSPPW